MQKQLESNVAEVKQRIDVAAQKSGRSAGDVCLVGVTKYVDAQMTRAIVEAGCSVVGENRPQVLWEKYAEISSDASAPEISWHLIGHLQRNKVKRTVALVSLIHSVDSLRLLDAINGAAGEAGIVSRVLLEVNVSEESAKHGFDSVELPAALEHACGLKHVQVDGLMGMAGLAGDQDDARREFAQLRELAEQSQSHNSENVCLKELSMGMSGDFEIAIEEGATIVRVGSLLLKGIAR